MATVTVGNGSGNTVVSYVGVMIGMSNVDMSTMMGNMMIGKVSGSMMMAMMGMGGNDSMSIMGTLQNMPAGFTPSGQMMNVTVAGVGQQFTLDSKGNGSASGNKVALKVKNAKGSFRATLHGSLAEILSITGVDSTKTATQAVSLPIGVDVAGIHFTAVYSGVVKSSANKKVTFK
jgi:hypothetical protein